MMVNNLRLLCFLVFFGGCAHLQKVVTSCASGSEDQGAERAVVSALSRGTGGESAALTSSLAGVAIEKAVCVLWRLVTSWTASTQAVGELGHASLAPWTARDPDRQPALDAIRSWLAQHGQVSEPSWK